MNVEGNVNGTGLKISLRKQRDPRVRSLLSSLANIPVIGIDVTYDDQEVTDFSIGTPLEEGSSWAWMEDIVNGTPAKRETRDRHRKILTCYIEVDKASEKGKRDVES